MDFINSLPLPLIPGVPIPPLPNLPELPVLATLEAYSNSATVKCLGLPPLPSIPALPAIPNLFAALAGLIKLKIPAIPNISLTPEIMVTLNCLPPIGFSTNFTPNSIIQNPTQILTQLKSTVTTGVLNSASGSAVQATPANTSTNLGPISGGI
jgi:hypothetical protein